MLRMILNIGKQTSERFGHPSYALSDSRIHRTVQDYGFTIRTYNVRQSSTEETAVMIVQDDQPFSAHSVAVRIKLLATKLHQDCIAACPTVNGTTLAHLDYGVLLGPYADAWGAFDPQFFIQE